MSLVHGTPTVSVLLPVYNAEKTVSKTVQSIFEQSWSDFELIAVDDGSNDDTALVLGKLGRIDPRIRLFVLPRRGLVSALNFGLSQCRGQFIARMDGDDFSRYDRLEKQVCFLRDHAETGLVSGKKISSFNIRKERLSGWKLHSSCVIIN